MFTKTNPKAKVIPVKEKKKKLLPPKNYLFWLKSSRGSDYKTIYTLPGEFTKDEIQEALESW